MNITLFKGDCLEIMKNIPDKRKFIGVELKQKYFNIAKDRLEKSSKQETIVQKTAQLTLFEEFRR